jgi:hypothetical protein
MRRIATLTFSAAAFAAVVLAQAPRSCESLKSLALPDTAITAAETLPAGPSRSGGPMEASQHL